MTAAQIEAVDPILQMAMIFLVPGGIAHLASHRGDILAHVDARLAEGALKPVDIGKSLADAIRRAATGTTRDPAWQVRSGIAAIRVTGT